MPRNLELKARISSLAVARDDARLCGARFIAALRQTDTYFAVPYGRLKLRETDGERGELIYYNRDESRDERWSHYTLIPLSGPAALRDILSGSMGIAAVVRKAREVFFHGQSRIHLDEVDGLGTFIEFEVQGSGEAESLQEMEFLRKAFHVVPEGIVRSSYADLVVEGGIRR